VRPTLDNRPPVDVNQQHNQGDANQPTPRERPERAPEDINTTDGNAAQQSAAASRVATTVAVILMGALAVALVMGGVWLGVRAYEGGGDARHVATGGAWAFARLARMTRWLRLQLSTADTPYEQAKTIGLVVPKRQEEIDHLADLYVHERYGRAEVDLNQTRSIWQRIHWSFWKAGVKRRLPRWLSALRAWFSRLRR